MKTFESIEQAKENMDLGKYECEKILVGDQIVTMCGTCLVYEDEVWNDARDLFIKASNMLGYHKREKGGYDDCYDYGASLVRDAVIKAIEEVFDCKIEHQCDEY